MSHTTDRVWAAAAGMAVGMAAGAVGSWVAAENKKEIRKMMKKAETGAMRALDQLESMRR